jgi:membrane protease YdiL (CAAX protease family)
MVARRFLPADPADFLRSIVPLGLLALAAAVPWARALVAVVLVVGAGIAVGRAAPVRWAWAAAVPVALGLAWQAWRGEVYAPSGLECTTLASPMVMARLAEALLVLGALTALAILLGASRAEILLRMPARRYWSWAIVGAIVLGPVALVAGPILARPFFGAVGYDITQVGAIVPALLFATANGVTEEVAYRGALMTWSAKVVGRGPALLGQAVIFGLAHSGTDVIGAPGVLIVAMTVAGLLAGVVALRTRSLLVPIVIHIAVDVPIYYAWACAS